jgi:glucokinase
VIGNDADVAGLAESLYGAGRGYDSVFYVTIGSGIGGGLILDGKIHIGAGRGAAEIGHLPTTIPGMVLEQVASGWGIQQRAINRLKTGETTMALEYCHGEILQLRTHHLAQAAMAGDRFARSCIQDAVEHLARALDIVIRLICPKRIVLGGGVSLMPETLFLEPLRDELARIVFPPFKGLATLATAELGENVVPLGAIALARTFLAV